MNFKQKCKDLFIPCVENGFKPNFLERMSMGIMLVLVLLSFAVSNLFAILWISSEWMVSTILPAVIVDLTNDERTHESLTNLRRSDVLDRAATLKAEDMAKNEYFAHYSPTGVSPWFWFDQVAYTYVHAGENLAVHFTDSSEVVGAWMNSPSHKANIMNGNYTEIGVGTAKGEYKGYPTIYVVQLFGTPAIKPQAKEVAGVAVNNDTEKTNITLETVTITDDPIILSNEEQIAPATTKEVVALAQTVPSKEAENSEISIKDENSADTTQTTPSSSPKIATEPKPYPIETIVLYSDLATSSRPGVPAIIETSSDDTFTPVVPETNIFERSATQPNIILQIIYVVLASVVVVSLVLSILIEWRRQNPVQIAYATGMLFLMALLFHVHTSLTSGVTIL